MSDSKGLVWVIEDDPDVLDMTMDRLEGHGYKHRSFTKAEDAVKALSNLIHSERPDAIITDNDTPGSMNGLHVLAKAKELNIPTIIFSASSAVAKEIKNMPKEDQPFCYMEKPGNPTTLLTLLEKATNQFASAARR